MTYINFFENIDNIQVIKNEKLSKYTTLGVGGKCNLMIKVMNITALQEVIKIISDHKIPFYTLGDGTNMFVSDDGFEGIIIKLVEDFKSCNTDNAIFTAGAGISLLRATAFAIENGFCGLEKIGAIPGSIGGAVYMNAGDNKCDTGKLIKSVTAISTKNGKIIKLKKEDCKFEYRSSLFQKNPGKFIITKVCFDLNKNPENIEQSQKELNNKLEWRKSILPLGKSAGCFFKNFPKESTGKLIDSCGLKNFVIKDAFVSNIHANFIMNKGTSNADNIYELSETVKKIVKQKTGKTLEYEVRMLGNFPSKNSHKKTKIAVLMGGISSERNISLVTGYEIIKALKDKYDIFGIDAADFRENKIEIIKSTPIVSAHRAIIEELYNSNLLKASSCLFDFKEKPDVCIIALHGKLGEDGAIQGMLEVLGIPYTGSGVLSHAIAIDKSLTKNILSQAGILMPKSIDIEYLKGTDYNHINTKFPVFVKPTTQGSSIGMTKVECKEDLQKAINLAGKYDEKILIEEFIEGTEITVGVLGNGNKAYALPCVEIIPRDGLYDLEAKYVPKLTNEICPARISNELEEMAKKIALKAHAILNCRGISRTDMIISKNKIYTLETNTIPGMTPTSLIPLAAKTYGISFPNLLELLIECAFREK